jgi:hypothetical protein
MPVRIVGMIGVTPPRSDAALHVIEGGLSPSYLTQFARAHDDAGFDLASSAAPRRPQEGCSSRFTLPRTQSSSATS